MGWPGSAFTLVPVKWALPEWTVLALLREGPSHGFAIATLTSADGALGRVWRIPRPVIYRALGRLEPAGLIEPMSVEAGAGPQRTIYALTDIGREAVDEWLRQPSERVRQLRSELLMKLALLDRRGLGTRGLLHDQRAVLEPIVAGMASARESQDGFDAVLLSWRYTSASAALQFVDDLLAAASASERG